MHCYFSPWSRLFEQSNGTHVEHNCSLPMEGRQIPQCPELYKIKHTVRVLLFCKYLACEHDKGSCKPIMVKNLQMNMNEPKVINEIPAYMINECAQKFVFLFCILWPGLLGTWMSSWIPQGVPAVNLENGTDVRIFHLYSYYHQSGGVNLFVLLSSPKPI